MLRFLSPATVAVALGVMNAALAAAAPESPHFTRLSVEDGLSQSSVQQILQDRKGLLWFGTQEGLNRYDGYRFTVHRRRDQQGFLRDHDITALIEDARGGLWVGASGPVEVTRSRDGRRAVVQATQRRRGDIRAAVPRT